MNSYITNFEKAISFEISFVSTVLSEDDLYAVSKTIFNDNFVTFFNKCSEVLNVELLF